MRRTASAVGRIKGSLTDAIPASLVQRIMDELDLTTRDRQLTPVVTTHLAVRRCLHGGTAITHLRRFTAVPFSPSAYCQAIQRLPVAFFGLIAMAVADRLRTDRRADRWHGQRVFLPDGSGLSMPDTSALQKAFGQPPGQTPGYGFPVAHLLAMFDHCTGYLVSTTLAPPLATHDLTHAAATHAEMRNGDLLLADRAFGSFAHIAVLRKRGLHGLFHLHQRRPHRTRGDRLVSYAKPPTKPAWMTDRAYAALPDAVTVREVRVDVKTPGGRVRRLTFVTTLLDRDRDPAKELAKLYAQGWRVETFHKNLKSGCRAEESKLRTADRLANLIAMMCILAWRVLWLCMVNRVSPNLPARLVFTDTEIKLLDQLGPRTGRSRTNRIEPCLHRLAKLGGYLARKRDGTPGNLVILAGYDSVD